MPPGVSVIVPVYNAEQYLNKCLGSILAQTFNNFECILVDDASPDNCPAICDEYAAKDNRFKVIHKNRNEGSSQARKTGLEYSSGKYILFIDSDDYIEVNMLEEMYSMAASQDYDMAYCDFYYHNDSNDIINKKVPVLSDNFIMNIKESILDFGIDGGAVWNKLIKKTIYDNITFPIYGYAEDKHITTQTLYLSKKIGYVNKFLYHYQFHQNSYMNDLKRELKKHREASNNFREVFGFLEKNYGKDLCLFEPELTKRREQFKKSIRIKIIIKMILRSVLPSVVYQKLKEYKKNHKKIKM
jgi:glycosyltransferase involved in cell wall biosynthesis